MNTEKKIFIGSIIVLIAIAAGFVKVAYERAQFKRFTAEQQASAGSDCLPKEKAGDPCIPYRNDMQKYNTYAELSAPEYSGETCAKYVNLCEGTYTHDFYFDPDNTQVNEKYCGTDTGHPKWENVALFTTDGAFDHCMSW